MSSNPPRCSASLPGEGLSSTATWSGGSSLASGEERPASAASRDKVAKEGEACGLRSSDEEYSVHVMKADFKFNAAHFVAYKGFRERLHGHNYTVGVRMWSRSPNEDGYVVDFGDIKRLVRAKCKKMNEYFLVPCKSDVLDISFPNPKQLQIVCEDGATFSFPRGDCAELPIVHSTVEELAQYFTKCLVGEMHEVIKRRGIYRIEVIVSEAPGQSASYLCPIGPSR